MTPNRYPLTLRDRVRFRHGLAWGAHIPTLRDLRQFAGSAALVLALLACYGVADLIDTRGDMAAQISAQKVEIDALGALVADCLNGRARFITPDQKHAVACERAADFPI